MLEGTRSGDHCSPLFRGQLTGPEVDPHEDRELNKAPVSAPVLSEGTAGFYLPTMDFSPLSFSYQLWEAAKWFVYYTWVSFTR